METRTRTVKATHKLPGMLLTGHEFELPLDYAKPSGDQITVFAREAVSVDNAKCADLPWIVFFQGGPGFPSPRPMGKGGWLKRALKDHRVLLLDDRGTGLSTPVTHQTLSRFKSPEEQADYLMHFRADNIVRDAEAIRKALIGDKKWIGLGQSYGGFCLTTYLSLAPEGLSGSVMTGGIPPVFGDIDDVYRATYKRVLGKNKYYYHQYPDDVAVVREIVDYLRKHEVTLPSGGRLSPQRFQQLGLQFGGNDGFAATHYALESAFVTVGGERQLSYSFLRTVESMQGFDTNPIYALLHESIYCEGMASNWSAERMLSEYPQFKLDNQPFFFTGEMVYSWMFEDYVCLRPLKRAAEILAQYKDWPALYDKKKLRDCEVPCAAAVYYDDMYVERAFSEEVADHIPNIKIWVTNEYEHSGIRDDGERILDRLLAMLNGEV